MIKRILSLLVACLLLAGIVVGCKKRELEPESPSPQEPSSSLPSTPPTSAAPEPPPPKQHEIDDPEKIANATAITEALLEHALRCDIIFTGNLPIDNKSTETWNENTYSLVVRSDLTSVPMITEYWHKTFVPQGRAEELLEALVKSELYADINDSLYIKSHGLLAPLTMGEWDTSTLRVISFDDNRIVVAMQATLAGQPLGEKTLAISKVDDYWLLDDSYFLDEAKTR